MTYSPLLIRRQALDAITALMDDELPKHKRDELVDSLAGYENPTAMANVLVRELIQATETSRLMAVAELLVELTTLPDVQGDLWAIIEDENTADAVKDAANLVLRNLGDTSDPDTYLDYLDDPDALIAEETGRMLALANENPSALVDFLDFTVSLPVEEQVRLLDSLRLDYPPEQLLPLYDALYWYQPPAQTLVFIKEQFLAMETAQAIPLLEKVAATAIDDDFHKQLTRHVQKLRLKHGPVTQPLPPLADQGELSHCYVTLPDGIGNQGVMVVRTLENGDHCLLAVAINDQAGILDAFGFYRLSDADLAQLVAKFHEANLKIDAKPPIVVELLHRAWWQSAILGHHTPKNGGQKPIPYEYTCWQPLLASQVAEATKAGLNPLQPPTSPSWLGDVATLVNEGHAGLTGELYLHPDFFTWFLEAEDAQIIGDLLNLVSQRLSPVTVDNASDNWQAVKQQLEADADKAIGDLLVLGADITDNSSDEKGLWHKALVARLALSAILLEQAGNHTFASLAATEAHALNSLPLYSADNGEAPSLTPFMTAFGRRCVLEHALRLARQNTHLDGFVQHLAQQWEPDIVMEGLLAELPELAELADSDL